jgi:hypothetical protein
VPLASKVGCPSNGVSCDIALVFIFLCLAWRQRRRVQFNGNSRCSDKDKHSLVADVRTTLQTVHKRNKWSWIGA